ncbi:hypothetical protein [Micromonospora craniellae]|uniref:Uncharacterized protein n=1 Tax=Micromonospora craniellae TaxID=2294034 RepID=A0A372FZC3_9ACTN|nr:hypothetical protein [Micromonospora craniellae]RFS45839.1 hypothetical protein D0Q02_14620 [Micromonospora craniellae]
MTEVTGRAITRVRLRRDNDTVEQAPQAISGTHGGVTRRSIRWPTSGDAGRSADARQVGPCPTDGHPLDAATSRR